MMGRMTSASKNARNSPWGSTSSPLTVGALRQYLDTNRLPDELPVIIGGVDFLEPSKEYTGVADAIWADSDGSLGGRLVIAAMHLGLADNQ